LYIIFGLFQRIRNEKRSTTSVTKYNPKGEIDSVRPKMGWDDVDVIE